MRPVNLLPEQHKPRQVGGRSGSAYVVIGVLAALVVGLAMYVLAGNQANDRRAEAEQAKQDAAQAQARLNALGSYSNFAQIAATRRASVEQLAQGRFDWERFLRETANVLPGNVWLTTVDASTTAAEGAGSGQPVEDEQLPGASMEGCAKRQSDVATLMVRLRQLHRVSEVKLMESGKSEEGAADSGGLSADSCGTYYKFIVKAVFELSKPEAVTPTRGPRAVPAKLGGGS